MSKKELVRRHTRSICAVLLAAAASGCSGPAPEESHPSSAPVGVPIARIADRPLPLANQQLVLHTSVGEITIALYPSAAPKHVERLLELTRLGVYDTVRFSRVEPGFLVQTGYPHMRGGPPLSAEQQAAIRPLVAEFTDLPHERGTVSMVLNDNDDPNSAETSFFITLAPAPFLDGHYTVVGRVLSGMDTVDHMTEVALNGTEPVEPIVIERAQVVS